MSARLTVGAPGLMEVIAATSAQAATDPARRSNAARAIARQPTRRTLQPLRAGESVRVAAVAPLVTSSVANTKMTTLVLR